MSIQVAQILVAEDGQRALEGLANRDFDLLLSDIVKPEVVGLTLALKATQNWLAMRILLMSG
jgi:YesN/AraC family two-component response regulator